ncbi:TerC family protein [Oceanicella actignis]|uniref:Membrane protein TerC, possibly involved in tellurium resistance n=1 Tax=Oceanicella actignis TaxID=1189325 RepID=A0A1M7SAP7_9RHOB|nr:TerC family protein [Oceanicella actignis]TYO91561.1 putative tellurium resistance membrane protein TerC [Oceanicella actignis]SET29604.1 Membrane protein TerC, possibly involved in tellurium resistance [Oceanicella actignis]SHN55454.1 Membrane protein TerC, possibly involved in tellurium resistance [Oceanicella actignis]
MTIAQMLADPAIWAAFLALATMEIVLGIDNLIFISIVSNRLPEARRAAARRIGIALALGLRLVMLTGIAWIVGLTEPVIDLGLSGPPGPHGAPAFETALSWRDIILIAGGLFLVWKATMEIHEKLQPAEHGMLFAPAAAAGMAATVAQIALLDVVFSIDSILTAVGMTQHVPVMIAAVTVAVAIMALAAGPVAEFVRANPTVVMLALAFLLMIGMVLIADGFGVHVPKGYIYAAMAFSAFVEGLNMLARRRAARRRPATRTGGE